MNGTPCTPAPGVSQSDTAGVHRATPMSSEKGVARGGGDAEVGLPRAAGHSEATSFKSSTL